MVAVKKGGCHRKASSSVIESTGGSQITRPYFYLNKIYCMKKITLTVLTFGMIFSGVSAFAEETVIIPAVPIVSPVIHGADTLSLSLKSESLLGLKKRGSSLIEERLSALSKNQIAITGSKTLTDAQKASLTTIINTNATGLQALQVKINAETDATSTKALVSSIYSEFRIFAIVIPKVRLEKRIYDLQNHSTKLVEAFTKVQVKINEAKEKGKDVSSWQKSLDEAKSLVTSDMSKLSSVFLKVDALKPLDYGTTSKAIIELANTEIKSVVKDFNSIGKKVRKPEGLRNLYKATTTKMFSR